MPLFSSLANLKPARFNHGRIDAGEATAAKPYPLQAGSGAASDALAGRR